MKNYHDFDLKILSAVQDGSARRRYAANPEPKTSSSSFLEWVLVAAMFVLVLEFLFVCGGCQSATKKASTLNQQIQGQAQAIINDVSSAQQNISAADQKVTTAATQPANPPETTALLVGAHSDLGNAQHDLAPVAPAAVVIQQKSTQAAAVTAGVQKKLDAERDHWLGYKTRVALWIGIPLLVILAIATFVLKITGFGPFVSILSDAVGVVWNLIKTAGTIVFHFLTLGAAKVADLVNSKKATAATATTATTAQPTPATK